jgi:2-phospho-L-lactate guanylyltransferase
MVDGIASVRRDVDTEVDLWDALRLGVGPRTKAIAAEL